MAGRGGIYKGPDGDDLHGDGTPVERSSGTISSGMVMQLQWEGAKAIAELARLTALLDRTKLAKVILRHQFPDTKWSEWGKDTQEANMQLADRLIAYLKPFG